MDYKYTDEEWEDLILSGMKLLLIEHNCYKSEVYINGMPLDRFTKEEIISIFSSWMSDRVPIFSLSQRISSLYKQSNNQSSNDSK